MQRQKQSQSFLALQAEWDRRLAKSGFRDIEDRASERLIDNGLSQAYNPTGNRDYYSAATDLLFSHRFASRQDKKIWELHCKGWPFRKISDHLGIAFAKVQRRVNKYKAFIL